MQLSSRASALDAADECRGRSGHGDLRGVAHPRLDYPPLHSVRQRLLDLSVSRGENPNLTLTRYTLERLLYRLAHSEYSGPFILKGAMLFGLDSNTIVVDPNVLERKSTIPERNHAVVFEFKDVVRPECVRRDLLHLDALKHLHASFVMYKLLD